MFGGEESVSKVETHRPKLRGVKEYTAPSGQKQSYRKREMPWHRVAAELAAQGKTIVEIAETVGKSKATVGWILRNDYVQQQVVDDIHENYGADEQVLELIKLNVVAAVETLADIMIDEDAAKRDRITAANSILERRYGKASQPITSASVVDLNDLPDSELAKKIQGN
jgi:transcriptional regulator with XRE-family HTH domain